MSPATPTFDRKPKKIVSTKTNDNKKKSKRIVVAGLTPLSVKRDNYLFIDVDGVLLTLDEQRVLAKTKTLNFSNNIIRQLKCIKYYTECNIVISSKWQFLSKHIKYIYDLLYQCGWNKNQICLVKEILNVTENEYEKPPYCQTRAKYVNKAIKKITKHNKDAKCLILDDLPLSSDISICLPNINDKNDIKKQIVNILSKYCNNIDNDTELSKSLTKYHYSLFNKDALLFGYDVSKFNEQILNIMYTINPRNVIKPKLDTIKLYTDLYNIFVNYYKTNNTTLGLKIIDKNFVKTNPNYGITSEITAKIVEHFNPFYKQIHHKKCV